MKIAEILTDDDVSVPPTATISEVAKKMRQLDVNVIPVFGNGRVLGMICDRDIVVTVVANDIEPSNCRASLFATQSPPVSVSPETELADAIKLMIERQLEHLCVADNSKLLGIVSLAGLIRASEFARNASFQKLSEIEPHTPAARLVERRELSGETRTLIVLHQSRAAAPGRRIKDTRKCFDVQTAVPAG